MLFFGSCLLHVSGESSMKSWVIVAVFGISAVMNVFQWWKVQNLEMISKAQIVEEQINDDNFRDLLSGLLKNESLEGMRNQGKLEGMLSIIANKKPDDSETTQIWHAGYQRGLDQNKDTYEMAYKKGLEAAAQLNDVAASYDKGYDKGYEIGYHKANADIACPVSEAGFQNVKNPVK